VSEAAPRCVVFDVDDTLYLERDYVRSGFAAVERWARTELAVPGVGEQAWSAFEAGHRGDLFDRALAALGIAPEKSTVERLVEIYRTHRPDIRLLPDALEALNALGRFARLAALTDGPAESQRAKCRALVLDRWCSPIIVTAELGSGFGKPSPEGFRRLEEATGCRGRTCVYVADNPVKDFAGPRQLDWRRVRIRRPGGLHAAVKSGDDVELELTSLGELRPALGFQT
jgi:putative hydrolase of the HAD superfamily